MPKKRAAPRLTDIRVQICIRFYLQDLMRAHPRAGAALLRGIAAAVAADPAALVFSTDMLLIEKKAEAI